MKAITFLLGLVAALPPPPVAEEKILPGFTKKDSVVKSIRYGPHIIKKAEVDKLF
jgi:hypothetical protein